VPYSCGPADRPTGKLWIKPVDHIRSLPVGRSAGPHYLYKPISEVRSATCHIRSHRLKVVI